MTTMTTGTTTRKTTMATSMVAMALMAMTTIGALLSVSVVTAFVIPSPSNSFSRPTATTTTTRLKYDIQRDPPMDGSGNNGEHNVWSVLASTERWIAKTLDDASKTSLPTGSDSDSDNSSTSSSSTSPEDGGAAGTAGSSSAAKSNPLSRKEVSYVCETSPDIAMILANIFRKLKEARQLGETHSQEQEELVDEQEDYTRATLRQTQVLVIPANVDLNGSFAVFDQLIHVINEARRNARDYVTDYSLEKLDDKMYGGDSGSSNGAVDRDWVVSVNCAHLHPKFGEKSPQQQLKELQQEEEDGEVDLNLQEYKERRLQARRSPYPSVVIEVRAMPPPKFTPPPPSGREIPPDVQEDDDDEEPSASDDVDIDSDFVNQLEALFSKSSLQKDGDFYDNLGTQLETISSVTPMMMAQNWIAENDPVFDVAKCAFTVTDAMHVDEAHEFVYTNLAMQTNEFLSATPVVETTAQKRQYLVMPHFLSSSATSMEKFVSSVKSIISALPSLRNKVEIDFFHPEDVDSAKRCPVPVFILQWKD